MFLTFSNTICPRLQYNVSSVIIAGSCGIEGEDDSYDFGTGAGFYVDATEEKWKTNYRMFSYVTKEVCKISFSTSTGCIDGVWNSLCIYGIVWESHQLQKNWVNNASPSTSQITIMAIKWLIVIIKKQLIFFIFNPEAVQSSCESFDHRYR